VNYVKFAAPVQHCGRLVRCPTVHVVNRSAYNKLILILCFGTKVTALSILHRNSNEKIRFTCDTAKTLFFYSENSIFPVCYNKLYLTQKVFFQRGL